MEFHAAGRSPGGGALLRPPAPKSADRRSEEHTSELQSRLHLVCRLLLEKKKTNNLPQHPHRHTRDRHPVRTRLRISEPALPHQIHVPCTSAPAGSRPHVLNPHTVSQPRQNAVPGRAIRTVEEPWRGEDVRGDARSVTSLQWTH